MIDFITLGNKYKKKFTVQFTGGKFFLKLYSQTSDNYIIDYHDGTFQQFQTLQNGYLQFSKNNCTSNKVSLAYNNYNIHGIQINNNNANKIVIQQLRHLKFLNVSENSLRYLITDRCTDLQRLIAFNNQLVQLNLDKNKQLQIVQLSGNNLKSLDLSNNNKLIQLSANGNELQQLHLPKSIKKLSVVKNKLKQIIFDPLNDIQYINVSDNQQLDKLVLYGDNIKKIVCVNTKLTANNIILENKKANPEIIFEHS